MKTNYIGRFSLLLVATLAAIIPAKADYDAWQEGVYYLFLEDQKARVVAADTKYKGDVTVTETFEQEGVTYTVTEVGDGAFYQCPNLTSVTLPATITAIGVNAFRESANLTAVNLPEGLVSIGNNAFHSCSSLASITLPASLLSIGEYAFYNCSASHKAQVHLTFSDMDAFRLERSVGRQIQFDQLLLVHGNPHFH